jgi:thioredoxin
MSMHIVLLTAAGAGIGALLGKLKSCPDGGCPLTANPRRGAIWGGIVGLLIALSASQGFRAEPKPTVGAESASQEIATVEEFQREVLDQPGMTVAYFYAEWCNACRYYAPTFDKVALDTADRARYVKIDVGAEEALAKEYQVTATPTTLFIKDGKILGRIVGRATEDELIAALAKAAQANTGQGNPPEENVNV